MHSAKNYLYVANAPIYLFIKIIPTDIVSIICLHRTFIEPQLHVNLVTLLLLLYEYSYTDTVMSFSNTFL